MRQSTIFFLVFFWAMMLAAELFSSSSNAFAEPGSRLQAWRREHRLSERIDNGAEDENSQPTTLRVTGKPSGTWRSWPGGITRLVKSEVTVKNVGSAEATGVRVSLIVPGGARVKLVGPMTIEPNKSAAFYSNQNVEAAQEGELRAEVSCSNCR